MSLETGIQQLLHAIEQGSPAAWLRRLLIAALVLAISAVGLLVKFNGFFIPEAMDQAQIGRQIATGQGFTTLHARPLSLFLMLARTGKIDHPLPEVSQAPLGPLINAAVLKINGTDTQLPEGDLFPPADRAIAATGFLFFAGALVLCYLLARRLFDARLAMLGTGLLIATDILWRFSFSGLPQMPMLFFFSGAMLALAGALDAQDQGRRRKAALLTLASALLLGITTLGNGLGLWIFAGFWIFAVATIRPRAFTALAAPALYALPLIPWALHNWNVMCNPFGLPFYELFRPPDTDPLAFQADFEPLLRFRLDHFLQNTGSQILSQATDISSFLGGNIVAGAFFLAVVMHTFRRWQAAQFRWAVLLMWGAATAGMGVFGVRGEVSVNQLHVLFLPLMVFYGLSFLLVMWGRLELEHPVLRTAFLVALYAIVSVPLVLGLLATPKRVNWPPYLPPLIERFSQWVKPGEALASDIPWSTAWYAGRISLLLPESIDQFELIHGERLLGAPLVGIYLTPYSANQSAYAGIVNGRYRDWARFVLREVRQEEIQGWMFKSAVNLPVDGEAIFFADRVRWQ